MVLHGEDGLGLVGKTFQRAVVQVYVRDDHIGNVVDIHTETVVLGRDFHMPGREVFNRVVTAVVAEFQLAGRAAQSVAENTEAKMGSVITLTVTGAEDVLWTSSDTNVATVDDTGLVTAGIPGTATITVTTADGSQSAACTVNVATPLPEPPKEKLGLRSIYQDKGETISEFSAKAGTTVQMRVDGTEQTVTWTIEDTKIATVDANGLVTAVAKGKTILKATVGDQSVSCFVIVN